MAKTSQLAQRINEWVTSFPRPLPPVGLSKTEALRAGERLRNQIQAGAITGLDLNDQDESADVLRAACRNLFDNCPTTPLDVLHAAGGLFTQLSSVEWAMDHFEERAEILCTLSFSAWRAARILDNTLVAQEWEAAYLRLFRGSLQWEVTKSSWGSRSCEDEKPTRLREPEAIFQALVHLRDSLETVPSLVEERALDIHDLLSILETGNDPDLQTFFLGESARIVGCAKKNVGRSRDAEDWFVRAEMHFRSGPSPAAQLTRLKANRLTLLYQLNHWDAVCRAAPLIDEAFARYGMTEDRVKWAISRAACLKVAGRLEEALEILQPFLENRNRVLPGLYGWVLLQCGDIHQILGDHSLAIEELLEAAELLLAAGQLTGLAQVNAIISLVFRAKGMLTDSLRFLQSSHAALEGMGMNWTEAYCRMLIAETYLAMGRPVEAETEIRAAIPVFEDEGMVADAVVAVSLLREAVRRQRLEPRPVVDIRDRFRPKK